MSILNFLSLRDLHDSTNDLLHSPTLKSALSRHEQGQTSVQMVSESSLKMLDSCGRTKDILFLVKTHIQDLQSTFHRITLGETSSTEKKFVTYHHHRKDLKKQMLKRLKSLKLTKSTNTSNGFRNDDNLMVVVNVLGEVRETIISLLDSLMLLMSIPNPNYPKPRKSMNSNGFVQVKAKFMRLNSLSPWENCDVRAVRPAIERLEAVESAVEDLEVELECIFKRLIRTRVLLLNILSN
ncbi:hypothetical protein SSX86_020131 [Deinandra increscens subsp. villosa]|uniref:Uncharacterized protein n=1 Tax=Deinandra increscens subsp. villosa TaxID=3103831 RepID=A0AAP0CSK3_9ASTR